jgi:hypothetical protein
MAREIESLQGIAVFIYKTTHYTLAGFSQTTAPFSSAAGGDFATRTRHQGSLVKVKDIKQA